MLLDKQHRKTGLLGNVSRLVLHLHGSLEIEILNQKLATTPEIQWLQRLRLKRRFLFQLPSWQQKKQPSPIVAQQHTAKTTIPAHIWQRDINPVKESPIQFDVVHFDNHTTALIFSWSHILMDARGAEILLRQLGNDLSETENFQFLPEVEAEEPILEQLNRAKLAKAFLIDGKIRIPSLLVAAPPTRQKNSYTIIQFTEEETQQIDAHARQHKLRLGKSPLLLAAAMRTFNTVLEEKGLEKRIFQVPIPQDQRRKGVFGPVMSNQVSYLFYRLNEADLDNISTTIQQISQQMLEQIRNQIPKNYAAMMAIARRLPLPVYSHLVKSPTKGALASFFFSDTGASLDEFQNFLGHPLLDAIHYPPNAGYPGLTIIFMTVHNKLKAVIGHTEASANAEEIKRFEQELRRNLLPHAEA